MNKFYRLIRYDWPLHFILTLTNWLPDNVLFINLRGFLSKPFFKKCGYGLGIGRNVCFYNPSKIEIGNNVYIAYGCWFSGNINIENDVLFGPYCVLAPTHHTFKNGSYRFSENSEGKINIFSGSWLGAHAMIIGNSSLGKGSLLAANSVLNSNTEDYSIYGGNPARLIKIKENES
jgi:acetyltransferase-like isoleucine patch superfamily enzyme